MSKGRVSGKSKPRGEPVVEDEDDYENVEHTLRPIVIGYWLLAIGYAPR
jgi:hypothetical protein